MRRRPKHELPVVPTANLVDIAILLIIFYMACSHFIQRTAGNVSMPKAPDLQKKSEPIVMVTIDDLSNVYIQGRPFPRASVEGEIASLIRDKKTEDGRTVMFKCDASLGRESYEPVLAAIAKAGALILAVGDKVDLAE